MTLLNLSQRLGEGSAGSAEQLGGRVARLLHGDQGSGVKQHASDEVDGMSRAC